MGDAGLTGELATGLGAGAGATGATVCAGVGRVVCTGAGAGVLADIGEAI